MFSVKYAEIDFRLHKAPQNQQQSVFKASEALLNLNFMNTINSNGQFPVLLGKVL